MEEKTFEIVNGDISDGYHTFEELYHHRVLLFLVAVTFYGRDCYYVEEHYPGWDLVVWESLCGQISYHIPIRFRALYPEWASKREIKDYVWDGHTSSDVLFRLADILIKLRNPRAGSTPGALEEEK